MLDEVPAAPILLVAAASELETLDNSLSALDLADPVAVAMKLLRLEALTPASLVALAMSLEMPAAKVDAWDLMPSILVEAPSRNVDAWEPMPSTLVEAPSRKVDAWDLMPSTKVDASVMMPPTPVEMSPKMSGWGSGLGAAWGEEREG